MRQWEWLSVWMGAWLNMIFDLLLTTVSVPFELRWFETTSPRKMVLRWMPQEWCRGANRQERAEKVRPVYLWAFLVFRSGRTTDFQVLSGSCGQYIISDNDFSTGLIRHRTYWVRILHYGSSPRVQLEDHFPVVSVLSQRLILSGCNRCSPMSVTFPSLLKYQWPSRLG